MHERLIAVLRRPQVMLALVSRRRSAFAGPGRELDPYREEVVPLSAIPDSVCPWKDKDLKAWRALSRVPNMSERAGLAIVRSIIGSVVDPEIGPALGFPLSFNGDPVDLRPLLCTPQSEQLLLDQLVEILRDVSESVDFPDWHWTRRQAIAELPREFRRSFLWGLHLSPWKLVEITLGVYLTLELEAREPLRRALARLLSFADRPVGVLWCDVIADLDPDLQVHATELILETGAYTEAPGDEARQTLSSGAWTDAVQALTALVAASAS